MNSATPLADPWLPGMGLEVPSIHTTPLVVTRSHGSNMLVSWPLVVTEPNEQLAGFYSPYFLVSKKDKVLHSILDLRSLNAFIKFLPFKMLDAFHELDPGGCGKGGLVHFKGRLLPRTHLLRPQTLSNLSVCWLTVLMSGLASLNQRSQ